MKTTFKKPHEYVASIKKTVLAFACYFSGVASIIGDVFLRKNFGVRRLSIWTAIIIAVVLAMIPLRYFGTMGRHGDGDGGDFALQYISWYVFIGIYLWVYWRHYRVIQAERRQDYSFEKQSYYRGDINPFFRNLKIKGKEVSEFQIEVLIEPACILIVGVLLFALSQMIGLVLIFIALLYSVSYYTEYYLGDEQLLDDIDRWLYQQYLQHAIMNDVHPSQLHGVQFKTPWPVTQATRKRIVQNQSDERPIYTAQ